MTGQEDERATPAPQSDKRAEETLTDWLDRRDREAFRRALEQRDLHIASINVANSLRRNRGIS